VTSGPLVTGPAADEGDTAVPLTTSDHAVEPPDPGAPEDLIQRYRRAAPMLEGALSLVLVLMSSVYLVRVVSEMAQTSLWTDELFSIRNWSGTTPWHAATDYETANNHVFTNILTASLPGADYAAWHARFWSFVAILGMQALVLHAFVRRGRALLGALVFYVFSVNFNWLDLGLQSRGYGMMALCAVVSSLCVWSYLERPSDRALVGFAIATWLGAWTIPSFLFFAAPLWVLLLVTVRSRRVAWFGLAAAAATALVYLPIIGDLYTAFRDYGDTFGRTFTTIDRVGESLHTYALNAVVTGVDLPVWSIWLLFGVALTVGFLFSPSPPDRRFVLLIVGAVAVFFAICLLLETPIVRTTAFVLAPLVVACAVSVGAVLYHPKLDLWRPLIGGVVVLVLGANALYQANELEFLPHEDWLEVGRQIEDRFPPGTSVFVTRNGTRLDPYLSDDYPIVDDLDATAFRAGDLVVVDVDAPNVPDFDIGAVAPEFTEVRVPQGRGEYQRILAVETSG
jgi:hypothetical protein